MNSGHIDDRESPSETQRPRELHTLTSMRFFAAMIIVVYHYSNVGPESDPELNSGRPLRAWLIDHAEFLTQSALMVDFFFVLSGFVLTYVYWSAWTSSHFNYTDFLWKRFARVYPLHLATLLFYLLFWLASIGAGISVRTADRYSIGQFFANLLMVHSWGFHEVRSFNGASWSVSCEWFAYLLFPVFLFILTRLRPRTAILLSVLWFFLLDAISAGGDQELLRRTADVGIARILAEFPFGVSCALWFCQRLTPTVNSKPATGNLSSGLFYLLLIAAFLNMQYSGPKEATMMYLAILVPVAAIAELNFRLGWLRNRWLVYGGEISYSIYLIHAPARTCIRALADQLHIPVASLSWDLIMLASAIAVLPLAHFSFIWLETPSRRALLKHCQSATRRRVDLQPKEHQPTFVPAMRNEHKG